MLYRLENQGQHGRYSRYGFGQTAGEELEERPAQ